MATITIHIDEQLKNSVQKNTKKEGITLTFLINQLLKAYDKGKIHFEIAQENSEYKKLSKQLTQLTKTINKNELPPLEDQLVDLL